MRSLATGLLRVTGARYATATLYLDRASEGADRVLHRAHANGLTSVQGGSDGEGPVALDGWHDEVTAALGRRHGNVLTLLRRDLPRFAPMFASVSLARSSEGAGVARSEGLLIAAVKLPGGRMLLMEAELIAKAGELPAEFEHRQREILRVVRALGRELARHSLGGVSSVGMAASHPALERMTPRERDVLQALLRGMSTKEVARAVGIKDQTAAGYIKSVYRHFGVHTRAELLSLYIRMPKLGEDGGKVAPS